MSTVIASDAALNTSLAGLLGDTIVDLEASSIVQSCVKIAQCVKGTKDAQSAAALEDAYTQEAYPLCRQVVSQQFTSTLPIAMKQNTLDSANHGDDMFFNGTLEDSPFDLLVDMQKIGDVLFVSNTEAPQVTLYDFPAAEGNNEGNNYAQFIGSSNALFSSILAEQTAGNAGNKAAAQTAVTTDTQALQQLQNYYDTINQKVSLNTSEDALNNNAVQCLPGGAGNTENNALASDEANAVNQSLQAANLQQALDTYNQAINVPVALQGGLTSPASQSSYSTSVDSIQNNIATNEQDNTNTAAGGDQNSKLQQCVNKCDTMKPGDKAVCKARCMCGTKYSNNGIFGISVCTVPVPAGQVLAGKSVQSVEEVVDELNEILTALRNSGQLIKHIKPKEFLETSLFKIKMNKIISFDMNVEFKPIYDSKLKKEQKEKEKSQNDATKDRARLESYDSNDIAAQKNKYIVLKNPIVEQQNNSSLNNQTFSSTTRPEAQAMPATLAQTLNNDTLQTIQNFATQNTALRQQVQDTLNTLNTTAGALAKKIEKGK